MSSSSGGDIPANVRSQVDARDQGFCRVCGAHVKDSGALHHIEYRSQGGLHTVENLVTVHFMYWPRCHERVHGRKAFWQPLLQEVVKHDGLYAVQLARWAQRSSDPRARTRQSRSP